MKKDANVSIKLSVSVATILLHQKWKTAFLLENKINSILGH